MSIQLIKDYASDPSLANRQVLINKLCGIVNGNIEEFSEAVNTVMLVAGDILPRDKSKVEPMVYMLKEKLKYDMISIIFDLYLILKRGSIRSGREPIDGDVEGYIETAISAAPHVPIDGVIICGSPTTKLIMVVHKIGDEHLELVLNSAPLTRVVLSRGSDGEYKAKTDSIHDLGCKHY